MSKRTGLTLVALAIVLGILWWSPFLCCILSRPCCTDDVRPCAVSEIDGKCWGER